jgi:hypothetical protein
MIPNFMEYELDEDASSSKPMQKGGFRSTIMVSGND